MAAKTYGNVKAWITAASVGAVVVGTAYFQANPGISLASATNEYVPVTGQVSGSGQQTLISQPAAQYQPKAVTATRARKSRRS